MKKSEEQSFITLCEAFPIAELLGEGEVLSGIQEGMAFRR